MDCRVVDGNVDSLFCFNLVASGGKDDQIEGEFSRWSGI